MISKPNTIYEIRYDFDLNGGEIEVPENCVLKFEGGMLRNGTVKFNNTNILGNCLLFQNCKVFGAISNKIIYVDWFGIVYNDENYSVSNVNIINKTIGIAQNNKNIVSFKKSDKIFITASKINNEYYACQDGTIKCLNNTYLDLNRCSLCVIANNYAHYSLISINNGVQNVTICNGSLIGDIMTHNYNNDSTSEWCYGIALLGCNNVVLKDLNIEDFPGDGICLYRSFYKMSSLEKEIPNNILIYNVVCKYNRRQGLSLVSGQNITISNSEFSYTGYKKYTSPASGIDIEPNGIDEKISNILISDCRIYNNGNIDNSTNANIAMYFPYDITMENVNNIIIQNCNFVNTLSFHSIVTIGQGTILKDCVGSILNITNKYESLIKNCVFNRLSYNNDQSFILENTTLIQTDCSKTGLAEIYKNDNNNTGKQIFANSTFYLKNANLIGDYSKSKFSDSCEFYNCIFINNSNQTTLSVYSHSAKYINPTLVNVILGVYQESGIPIVNTQLNLNNSYNGNVAKNNGLYSFSNKPYWSYNNEFKNIEYFINQVSKTSDGFYPKENYPNLIKKDTFDAKSFSYDFNKIDTSKMSNLFLFITDNVEFYIININIYNNNIKIKLLNPVEKYISIKYNNNTKILAIKNNNNYFLRTQICGMIDSEIPNRENYPDDVTDYIEYNFSVYGITYQRPSDISEGFEYYDSDLKKKILWNGSAWVNMDGSALD